MLNGKQDELVTPGSDGVNRRGALRVRDGELLQTILDNVPVMLSFIDAGGHHTWVNRCWEQTLGWSLDEAGRHDVLAAAYPDPDARQRVIGHIARVDGKWHDFHTRTRDGTMLDTSWVNVRLRDGAKIGIGLDITERKRAEAALERRTHELELLHERLSDIRESERENLARDLHDDIGAELSSLGLSLGVARLAVEKGDLASLQEIIGRAERQVEHVTRSVRLYIAELRPAILDDYGLVAGIRAVAERIATQTGLVIDVLGPDDSRFSREVELALYRITQEALANVVKHAAASRVTIALTMSDAGPRLSVRDDGGGFIPEDVRGPSRQGGMGLIDMRERAASIGARFVATSVPGQGTEVVVEMLDEDPHS